MNAKKTCSEEVICWGTGSPLREFLHVDDLALAALFVLENWNPDSPNAPMDKEGNPLIILNVGTGLDISIKDLAQKIAKYSLYKGDISWDKTKPNGTPKKLLNSEKINQLGWEAKTSLDEGIVKTIKSFKKENL